MFDLELRTLSIRKVIEELVEDDKKHASSSIHANHLELYYGVIPFKCQKPWCDRFSEGFDEKPERDQHVNRHERPFLCTVDGCFGADLGFESEAKLHDHNTQYHSDSQDDEWDFPSANTKQAKDICKAAAQGDLHRVKELLAAGEDIMKTSRAQGGQTPLHLAALNGHLELTKFLLEEGADVNFIGPNISNQETVLHAAVKGRHGAIVQLLLNQTDCLCSLLTAIW